MHMHRILGAGAALLATSVLAAPLDLGLNLSTLNKCLFSDPLTKLRLDATKVLDLSSNTCLSTTACLATKTNQIVTQTVAGVLQVPVCQRKTCPEGVTLNSEGLCVCLDAKVLVGSASSAYCAPAPKTCQDNLVLSSAGVCVCPSGSIFKDASKTICITSDKCDTLLNVIRDGTCVSKTCSSGQFLNTVTGQCVSSCDTLLNTIVKVEGGSLCQPKPCGSNMTLDKSTGACVCASGFVFSNASKNTCITVSTCDLKLNEILNGVCLPKVCAGTQLLNLNTGLCISLDACPIALNTIDNGTCKPKSSCTGNGQSLINGICLCSSGYSLNSAGVCALPELLCKAGQLLNANKSACIDSAFCPLSLNYVSNGVCLPRTSCSAAGQTLSNGVCLCDAAKGFSLGFLGLCVKLNAGLGQGLGLGLGL